MDNQNENADEITKKIFNLKGKTYCVFGDSQNGFFETDLKSYKEEGTESRFIAFKINGFGDNNEATKSSMIIPDEETFLKFKEFITQLNWND